jgi:hypothetical protein
VSQQIQHPAGCKRAGGLTAGPLARRIPSVSCETLSSVACVSHSWSAVQGACVEQDKMLLVTEFMDGVCMPLYDAPALVALCTVVMCRPVMLHLAVMGCMMLLQCPRGVWVQVATCPRPLHGGRSPGSCGACL